MALELNRLASFLFHPEGGRLVAASQEAAAESKANHAFLREATARFGTRANVSPEVPLTLQH